MKDSNGTVLKDGDFIKTERCVVLKVEKVDNEFYMLNSDGGKSSLSVLRSNFYILKGVTAFPDGSPKNFS